MATITTTDAPLPEPAARLRLQAVLSPAFPTGAFSFSHGLERAAHDGLLRDEASLHAWLETLLDHGSLWNDAVLLSAAWRGDEAVDDLALALAGSRERLSETAAQGEAFRQALPEGWGWEDVGDTDCAYPIAVGRFARSLNLPLETVVGAYLLAAATNLVQAAIRLIPVGQKAGLRVLAALEPPILAQAAHAALSSLDDLGSASFLSEIAAMRHETQYSRIFRS